MACSRAQRWLRGRSVALLVATAGPASGCWTGAVYQSARIQESVTGYSAAWTDGERLRLGYDVAITDANGRSLGEAPRAVDLRLEDLAAVPEIAVDVFPAHAARPGSVPRPEETRVPIVYGSDASALGPVVDSHEGTPPLVLRVRQSGGRVDGFDLYTLRVDGTRPDRVGGLYSEALYRSRTAWWVYPCLPFAAAVDLLLLPFQIATAPPLLLIGR